MHAVSAYNAFLVPLGIFTVQKQEIYILFSGVSPSNCYKFIKICPFSLLVCPAFFKRDMTSRVLLKLQNADTENRGSKLQFCHISQV